MLNETAPSRFWAKVDYAGPKDCWEWRAGCTRRRYGRFQVGSRALWAHRVAWELAFGPIPNGLCVLHTCDNPPCVNPAHLWLGTQADNIRDMDAKGRRGSTPGVSHGCARLTNVQILAIRTDHRILRKIAVDYGVCTSTISHIKRRETWTHI